MKATEHELTAGGWTLRLTESGALANIFLGDEEVLRGLAVVVRDADWGTVEGEVVVGEVRAARNSFDASVTSRNRRAEIDFEWKGTVSGTADGVVRFDFRGEARSRFRSNRIGLVALHSLNWAGRTVEVTHSDGSMTEAAYPALVSPHQPFLDVASLRQRTVEGCEVKIDFTGDVFETEDQRNWSDGSFKTYSRPLACPFPVDFTPDDVVRQAVILSAGDGMPGPRVRRRETVTITVHDDEYPWPRVGVTLAQGDGCAEECGPVRAGKLHAQLNAAWMRAELSVSADGSVEGAEEVARAANTGVPLELCVTTSSPPPGSGTELRHVLGEHPLAALVVYTEGSPVTSEESVRFVQKALREAKPSAAVPVIAGTDGNLAELNRNARDLSELDGVTLSINAQVHDSSPEAVMHTVESYRAMIATARAVSGNESVTVSPLMLKPRHNLYATSAEDASGSHLDPQSIDPRQSTAFAAAFAAAAIGELARAGVSRLTAFEDSGPRGLTSSSGECWPIGTVIATAAAGRVGIRHSESDSSSIGGFVTETAAGRVAVIANLTAETISGRIRGLDASDGLFEIPPYDVVRLHAREGETA